MIGAHALTIRADITYRQLDYWTRVGYLTPVHQHLGPGFPREYPDDQIELATLLGQLVKAGLAPKAAHQAALDIIAAGHAILGDFTLTPLPGAA
jgi:DNA-binding transcriptional MerR regulator